VVDRVPTNNKLSIQYDLMLSLNFLLRNELGEMQNLNINRRLLGNVSDSMGHK